jgi:hypothetical protein
MHVMVFGMATKEVDAEPLPIDMKAKAAEFEAMGKFIEELTKAGIMVMGEGLKPSRFGKRVQLDGSKRTVTDGPFTESKELVAGFMIWEVRSMDEAIEWVKRYPNPTKGPGTVVLRPALEPVDFNFGGEIPPEEKAQWEKMSGRDKS